ncbi:hypothetical protein [Deinococcus peraridilitoris]|uniref:Uncharacterized protein n=1 Tax=Deinococcus peraridilitoris (strain DSM 19664 / LMG 22246 / CIP 109416 / KR-200) TaxID=937777 RepID=L0A711_DEIPD|nr:hypothetical protein [Deinococcus peraridilitoris]AFZ69239.1 hypothetical protein Deipe_3815 [Deinococcus peraridilitoris DSM 19664]
MKSSIKLGREMKLALTGVALVGAVGGWSVWNAGRPPVLETPPGAATSSAGDTQSTDGGVTVSRPNKPVDVQPIPFLNTAQPVPAPSEEAAAPTPAAPRDAELSNPFRPFTVTASAQDSAPVNSAPVNAASGTLPAPTIPNVPRRSVSPAPAFTASTPPTPVTPSLSAPIPVPTLEIVPAPALPRSTPPVAVAVAPTAVPPVSIPQNTAPFPTQGAVSVISATPPKAPPKPPVPTVRAPTVATLSTPLTLPGASSSAAVAVESPSPAVPPLLAELETPTVAASMPANPLDAYVSEQNLSYNAVVLGPVSTVIFQSKTGYTVVSLGQKLPESDIVITDISATSVTLALGDSHKTLEIDKR